MRSLAVGHAPSDLPTCLSLGMLQREKAESHFLNHNRFQEPRSSLCPQGPQEASQMLG